MNTTRVILLFFLGTLLMGTYSCDVCADHADCPDSQYCLRSEGWFEYAECKAFNSRPCEGNSECAGCEYIYNGEAFTDFLCVRGQCLLFSTFFESNAFNRGSVETCDTELACDSAIEFEFDEISIQECEAACGVAISNNDDGDFPGCKEDQTTLVPVSDFTVGGYCCR